MTYGEWDELVVFLRRRRVVTATIPREHGPDQGRCRTCRCSADHRRRARLWRLR